MIESSGPTADDSNTQTEVPNKVAIRIGLGILSQASAYARDAGVDPWDFAVEIANLYAIGLSIDDLRWLVDNGFAESGQETSVYGERHRSFRRGVGFDLDTAACFVLTPKGVEFAGKICGTPPP